MNAITEIKSISCIHNKYYRMLGIEFILQLLVKHDQKSNVLFFCSLL